ncbi:phosphotransferase [Granulosicoccus sp. 3-233]|uniref:phosphotransferase n=1 Tax=Granulosicoccus sp. 3-233 TaxID=3417969 RepID=UPI003D325006
MPSHADLEIIKRESRLPGLALMLDNELLSQRLGINLEKTSYFNYKPGTSCTAGVVDGIGNAHAVMAYPPERFAKVKARSELNGGESQAILLDDACVALVPMALDRHLRAARKLTLAEQRGRFLQKLLPKSGSIGRLETVMLRYKPNRRIVSRLHVNGYPRALVKCVDPRGFGKALVGARLCSLLSGVQILGINDRRHSIASAWTPGPSLCPVLSGELHREALFTTGSWLAQFHESQPEVRLPFTRETHDSLMRPLLDISEDYTRLAPRLSPRLNRLASLANEVCSGSASRLTLIHGDFSADQVILADENAAGIESTGIHPVVIDWDRAMIGNPLRDVGCFLARLEHQSLDGSLDLPVARCAQQAFIDGYQEVLPDTDMRLIQAFHARALLLLIFDGFRQRHANWYDMAEVLLGRVESLLKRARVRPHHESKSEATAMLTSALDIDAMRKPMMQLLAPTSGALTLASARLLRHKPGRRALIRYDLRQTSRSLVSKPLVVLGKLRFRKPDVQTPALHDLLRDAGLNESNPQGVCVPENLGVHTLLNIWFQAMVPGKELSLSLEPGADSTPFEKAGRALSVLHSTPVSSSRRWSLQSEAEVLAGALDKAISGRPDLTDRLMTLRDVAMHAFGSLPETRDRLIHRDFYQDQLLIDGDRIWLLDLDLVSQGDPAIDVGNFLAHIKEFALRRYGCVSALQPLEQAFVQGYAAAGALVDERRICLLESLSLARHLYISTQFADRRHTTDALLDYCEKQLASRIPRDFLVC